MLGQAGFSFARAYSPKFFEKDQVCQIKDIELNTEAIFL